MHLGLGFEKTNQNIPFSKKADPDAEVFIGHPEFFNAKLMAFDHAHDLFQALTDTGKRLTRVLQGNVTSEDNAFMPENVGG